MAEKTVLLVEDDYLNRRLTKKILMESGYKVLEAKNKNETISILKQFYVDLAILDINLGENEQDGVTIGHIISKEYDIPYIYLTAYESPDVLNRAIETSPHSYITKPFKKVDLIASVELAIKHKVSITETDQTITVKEGDFKVVLPLKQIDYIVSEGNYLSIHTVNGVYKYRSTLKQMLEKLPVSVFIQTHRAYLVNKSKIEKYDYSSIIIGNAVIPVSKNYIDLSNGL